MCAGARRRRWWWWWLACCCLTSQLVSVPALPAPPTPATPATLATPPDTLVVVACACGSSEHTQYSEREFARYLNKLGTNVSNLHIAFLSDQEACGGAWSRLVSSSQDGRPWRALHVWCPDVAACAVLSTAAVPATVPTVPTTTHEARQCLEPQARASILLHLARTLRWRTLALVSSLATDERAQCISAARVLAGAGLSVWQTRSPRAATLTSLRPHAVVVCAAGAGAGAAALHSLRALDAVSLPARARIVVLAAAPASTYHHHHHHHRRRQPSDTNITLVLKKLPYESKREHYSTTLASSLESTQVYGSTYDDDGDGAWENGLRSLSGHLQRRLVLIAPAPAPVPAPAAVPAPTSLFQRVVAAVRSPSPTRASSHPASRAIFTYRVYDRAPPPAPAPATTITAWRLVLEANTDAKEVYVNITKETEIFEQWVSSLTVPVEQECEHPGRCHADGAGAGEVAGAGAGEVARESETTAATTTHLLVAAGVTLVVVLCVLGSIFAIRCIFFQKRFIKSRTDVMLSASEFTFPPTAADARRVGEGMETMLSCWLQQLHEFGGPEPQPPPDPAAASPAPLAATAAAATAAVAAAAPDQRTRYKGEVVQMKYLPVTGPLELKRKTIDTVSTMRALRHENLNPFLGCSCSPRPALVSEHCSRGSLEDVLRADDIKLDWTFRLSLLTDLVKGMRYLHGSSLRCHGRLSSRNCTVDSRWVLRVTDYGLAAFNRAQGLHAPPRSARESLWTAPELLRERHAHGDARGSQPGDVFSFGIIMQEVILRGEPYCMLPLPPEDIVEKLKRPPPLIRPSVSMSAAPPEAVSVMRQCWSEQPDLRPDFHHLYDLFRDLHRGRKVNIIDSMFEMLEKYSNNLEELIRERTDQLDMEKKKTEQLLNRMLPRSVAERLLAGSRVEPEEFEDVTVYFSDIVGFTELAARSTPVQVVGLLNDLYTRFDAAIQQYRVYKVETIGDAYMVVGGLPERAAGPGHEHAAQVATMALHLLHEAGRFRIRHLPGAPLHLRSGVHSGPCCAAVVGLTMPRYCLFGDTVNTAARMEQTGAAWRVQVSAATAARLRAAGGYRLRSRGLTPVKGKGAMHTYWLLGKDGFDCPLPEPPPLPPPPGRPAVLADETASLTPPTVVSAVLVNDTAPQPPSLASSAALADDDTVPSPPPSAHSAVLADETAPLPPPPYGDDELKTFSNLYDRYRCGSRAVGVRRQWSLESSEEAQRARLHKQHSAGAAPAIAAPATAAPATAAPATAAPPHTRYRTRACAPDTQ